MTIMNRYTKISISIIIVLLFTNCARQEYLEIIQKQQGERTRVYAEKKKDTVSPELVIQTGHLSEVTTVIFSSDSKILASGGRGKIIKLWDTHTGKEIHTLTGHLDPVTSMAFSHDDKLLASGSNRGDIKIWDVRTGRELGFVKGNGYQVSAITFSPDNSTLATSSWDDTIKLWDVSTGKKIRSFKASRKKWPYRGPSPYFNVASIEFSPDGNSIIIGGLDGYITIRNLGLISFPRKYKTHSREITCLSFSPNGRFLATGSFDRTIKIRDVPTGKVTSILTGFTESISSVRFSPDSRNVISADKTNTIKVWDVQTGQEIRTATGRSEKVNSVTLSSDGKIAASLSWDNTIKLWDTRTGRVLRALAGHSIGERLSVAFNPDGHSIASGGADNAVKIWDVQARKELRVFAGHTDKVKSVAFSPDGRILVSGSSDNTVKLWNVGDGKELKTLAGHTGQVVSVAFNPDGRIIASGSWDNTVKLWDVTTDGEIGTLAGHTDPVLSVAFSPDGKLLASGSWDSTIKIWNAHTAEEIRTLRGHIGGVGTLAFNPDGDILLSGSWDKSLKLWNINTGKEIRSFIGHEHIVYSVAFSPDGNIIASSSKDNAIKLWDIQTGNEIGTMTGHLKEVNSIAFSPDSRLIASGSADETIKIWDVKDKKELATIIGIDQTDYVITTPDHYYTASKGGLKGVAFRIDQSAYPFEQFDLKFNRPDITLQRIGYAPNKLIEAYRNAYRKRLNKMGFTEEMLSDDFHLPKIKILTEELPLSMTKKTITFKVKAIDSKYLLDRLNVHINAVPVYGTAGIDLRHLQTSTHEQDITFELSDGPNKIQVSALNQRGAESLSETFDIVYNGPAAQPKLYIVSIGVSDYASDDFDLAYASKDAQDIITFFQENNQHFESVRVKKIFDTIATKENILNIREWLMNTKVDDHVILFFAGHGILDEHLDYYFATTDIDFYNPSERGLTYKDIEGLVDGIPSRKKLLLIDTCHSGEVDKEDVTLLADSIKIEGGIVRSRAFRGLTLQGIKVNESSFQEYEQQLGLQNSFELMQELFSDLRRGSGAVVISSASGVEFAFESPKWKNGVFTYALLHGLQGQADVDGDGEIRVSELWEYIIEKVPKLTHNYQKPTTRRENLEFDFRVSNAIQ